jgi:hypothetical protein
MPFAQLLHTNRASMSANDTAVRMVTETAHDLRSPLTSVRESIRLIRDGDLGPITEDQQSQLDSAADQCGCIEQVVGQMVQLERLRVGTPGVHRQGVAVGEIRHSVEELLRPWIQLRSLRVMWDGTDDPMLTVFADRAMLCRLLTSLAIHAARASARGSVLLIRAARLPRAETVRWSVIDRGGPPLPAGARLDHGHAAPAEHHGSAESGGFDLEVSRQLAALHFSTLRIRARVGNGTEVSFETALDNPRSVARMWSRWRASFRVAASWSTNSQFQIAERVVREGERSIRLDMPLVSVALSHEASRPQCDDRFSAGVITLGGAVARMSADQFDQVLQSQMQLFDLAYRVGTRRWVWCLDADAFEARRRLDAIAQLAARRIPGIRINGCRPRTFRVHRQRGAWQLTDLMIRHSLLGSAGSRGLMANELRESTTKLEPSAVATARLDAELWRLTHRQSASNRHHASSGPFASSIQRAIR